MRHCPLLPLPLTPPPRPLLPPHPPLTPSGIIAANAAFGVLDRCHITSTLARGIAVGGSAHALGKPYTRNLDPKP